MIVCSDLVEHVGTKHAGDEAWVCLIINIRILKVMPSASCLREAESFEVSDRLVRERMVENGCGARIPVHMNGNSNHEKNQPTSKEIWSQAAVPRVLEHAKIVRNVRET